MAKGHGKPIAKTTKRRTDKRGGGVFLDVCGPKSVRLMGGKTYVLLIKYDFSRCSTMCLRLIENYLQRSTFSVEGLIS